MEESSMVDTFVSITATDPDIALHYLEACNWELENAVNTYLEDYQHPVEPEPNRVVEYPLDLGDGDIQNELGTPYADEVEEEVGEDAQDDFRTPEVSVSPVPTDPFQSQRNGNDFREALDLPDGFGRSDVEEQRMLMTALQGIPFTGNLEPFLQPPPLPRPPSPGTLADRELKKQQDEEYEAAKRLDEEREKEKIEKERQEREEAVMEAARKRQESESLFKALDVKKRSLPIEPSSEEGIVVVMRFPDGSRSRRRFRKTDPISALFDFVDVEVNDNRSEVAGWWRMGGYNLATQYPRRVIEEDRDATLETAGLTDRQEMLFVEIK